MNEISQDLELVNDTLRTKYWSWVFYDPQSSPLTLLDALKAGLPHVDHASWNERLDFGGAYINGRAALMDQPLPYPCKIEYYEPKFEIAGASQIFPEFKEEYVIFRDEHILVAYKPPGLSSMPAKEQRHFSMKTYLERFTGSIIHMPSRLDVSTQGLLITSISSKAHAKLQQAFEHRLVKKEYLCATHIKPTWSNLSVNLPIGRAKEHSVLRVIDHKDGQAAQTELSVLGSSNTSKSPIYVLSAKPLTGRTHQIRVHTATSGVPILGDKFYGGAPATSLHLVSFAVACLHPVTGKQIKFTLPKSLQPSWFTLKTAQAP
jgi:23S rRNA-/tRNA-specific pseudouridylate synthase